MTLIYLMIGQINGVGSGVGLMTNHMFHNVGRGLRGSLGYIHANVMHVHIFQNTPMKSNDIYI